MGLQLPKCWVTLRGNERGERGAEVLGREPALHPEVQATRWELHCKARVHTVGLDFCCLKLTGVWFCVHILRELLQCQGSQKRKGCWRDHPPGEQSRWQDKARTQGGEGTVTSTWFPLLSSLCNCLMASGLISSFSLRKQGQQEPFTQLTEQSWLPGGFAFAHEHGSNGSLSNLTSFSPVF